MDENYLDSLLNGVSSDSGQLNDFDKIVAEDSSIDVDTSDLDSLSVDEFDDLSDLDLSDLDFDDLDFDDLDVTSLDVKSSDRKKKKQEEDYSLDNIISEMEEEEKSQDSVDDMDSEVDYSPKNDSEIDDMINEISGDDSSLASEAQLTPEEVMEDTSLDANGDDMSSTDAFAGDMTGDDMNSDANDSLDSLTSEDAENAGETSGEAGESSGDVDLDDLFSALGIEDESGDSGDSNDGATDATALDSSMDDLMAQLGDDFPDIADLADIKDISEAKEPKKKGKKNAKSEGEEKKSLGKILFGEMDEEELADEEEYKAKKEAKKAEKATKKEEKKAAKAEKLEIKKNDNEHKAKEKAEKKNQKLEKRNAEAAAEAAAEPSKPVPLVTTIIIFVAFAIGAAFVVLGTKGFNYKQVIKKATDYFNRQRYRLAYDEVAGVEVKEKDEDLKDRIYTVMYVERLYESFENNQKLGRDDKALDALVRGVEKYDEHYNEAVELEIVDDINVCRGKIILALKEYYGMSEADVYAIMKLEGQDYLDALTKYTGTKQVGE